MADKNEIAFDLEVKGVEQSIKSVKDLKSAITALQNEAENADIGSDQYKNAIENIEKLNDKLKEVTQTEKQAAKATEEMVEAEKEAAKKTGDLREQFTKLEDQLFLLAGQGKQNTKEFRDLSNEAAELNAKIDEVNQTLGSGSSGIDKLGASLGMLSEGLTSMNFDKVKAGFKGIGQAMSAVPLILLVQGVQYLVEKFEIFKIIGEAVEKLFYALTDAIGLTNKAAEQQSKDLIAGMKEQEVAVQNRYDAEIKLAKAAGKETADLELDKLKSTEDSIAKQVEAMKDLQNKKGKLNDEEQKNYDELQVNLLKASSDREAKEIANNKEKVDKINAYNTFQSNIAEDLRVAKLSEREKEIDAIRKASAAKLKELNDKEVFNHGTTSGRIIQQIKKNEETKKQINELAQIEINKINAKYNAEAAAKNKAHLDALQAQEADAWFAKQVAEEERKAKEKKDEEQKAIDEQLRLEKLAADQDAQMARYTANKNKEAEIDKKKREEEKALELAKQNEILNFAQMSTQSHQALSDAFFAVKNRNLQKGSAAERKSAEQQFKVNKALAIQSAVITGIQGVMNALSAQSVLPEPIATVLRVATAVGVGIAAAANIAKIASTKFDAGGGGGGGGAAALPSAPPIPSPPSISTQQNNTSQSTSFDETGKRIGGDNEKQMAPVIQVKATVGVDEVSSKTNRVETLEKQSTF